MSGVILRPNDADKFSQRQILGETKLRKNRSDVYNLIRDDLTAADTAKIKLIAKASEKTLHDCFLQICDAFDNDEKKTIYEVPMEIIGDYAEYYEQGECMVYIIHTLRQRNFYVRFKKPNFIIISWINPNLYVRKTKTTEILEYEDNKTTELLQKKFKERDEQR